MPDDRHDHDDLIGLGYDEHDIADRNLTIERDGDTWCRLNRGKCGLRWSNRPRPRRRWELMTEPPHPPGAVHHAARRGGTRQVRRRPLAPPDGSRGARPRRHRLRPGDGQGRDRAGRGRLEEPRHGAALGRRPGRRSRASQSRRIRRGAGGTLRRQGPGACGVSAARRSRSGGVPRNRLVIASGLRLRIDLNRLNRPRLGLGLRLGEAAHQQLLHGPERERLDYRGNREPAARLREPLESVESLRVDPDCDRLRHVSRVAT